jgi:hypothetical protein
MKKISIIVFYFGKFPWYHDFFISSCLKNPDVDFLVFSDNFSEERVSQNIRQIPFSVADFNRLATQKLGIEIAVRSGLKICDLRPAFGVIFEDFLKDADFWGYSDTDLILGNVRGFLTVDILENYDFISVKDQYPSGFFAVLRNTEKINRLFTKSKDYKALFAVPENTLFEECGGYYDEITSGINILDTTCPFETFHHVLEKNKSEVRSLFDFFSIEGSPGSIAVKDNMIIFMDRYEVMMYHLTNFKSNYFLSANTWKSIPENYYAFKYSIQKQNWFGAFKGKATDFTKSFFLNASIKIESKLGYSRCSRLGDGNFQYMQEIVHVKSARNTASICINDRDYKICKSAFHRKLYLILQLNLYFFMDADQKSLKMISPNGYLKSFRKI